MNGSSPAPAFKPQFAPDFLSQDASAFQQQAARGDFSALRQFLAKNRQTPDWQDRYFILDVVAPSIAPRSLDPLCAIESKAADLALMQGAHFFDLVSKARGAKTADKTNELQMNQAAQFIKASLASLNRAKQLDLSDPTPHVFAMRCFQVFSDLHTNLHQAYQQAIGVSPDYVPAHFVMVNAQSEKWGGSHAQSLQVARSAMSHAKPGSDAASCLFLAHILVWQHAVLFEKNRKRADAYLQDASVSQELHAAFEKWIRPPYQARRSSVPYLHHAAFWFYQAGDRARLQQALAFTKGKTWDKAWSFAGDGAKTYASALEFASTGIKNDPAAAKKNGLMGWLK